MSSKNLRARIAACALVLAGIAYASATSRAATQENAAAGEHAAYKTVRSNGGRYVLHVTEPEGGFVRGKPLAFDVRVLRADDPTQPATVGLLVDADMPEHLHGTNRVPRIERRADGTFRVENLYLHMPGWWEVFLDVVESPWTERAQLRVEVE